jgi:hypothetical protein
MYVASWQEQTPHIGKSQSNRQKGRSGRRTSSSRCCRRAPASFSISSSCFRRSSTSMLAILLQLGQLLLLSRHLLPLRLLGVHLSLQLLHLWSSRRPGRHRSVGARAAHTAVLVADMTAQLGQASRCSMEGKTGCSLARTFSFCACSCSCMRSLVRRSCPSAVSAARARSRRSLRTTHHHTMGVIRVPVHTCLPDCRLCWCMRVEIMGT